MSDNRPLASPRPRGILKNASYHRDSYDARPSASLDTQKEQEDQDETSPLLAPRRESVESALTISSMPSPQDSDPWNNIKTEETKSQWYLILLTLSIGGLQIAWSVELSNGSVSPTVLPSTPFTADQSIAISAQFGYQQVAPRLRLDCRPIVWYTGPALRRYQERQVSVAMGKEKTIHRWRCHRNDHISRPAGMDQGDCEKLLCHLQSRCRVPDRPRRLHRVGCQLHLHS